MADTASCRILVVSPTAARAHQFVQRVQALSGVQALSALRQGQDTDTSLSAEIRGSGEQTSVSTSHDPLAAGSSTSIPWTIANKYYTADVHFETHEFEQFRVHHAIGVPAIIYVWGPGEPYRDHIPEIAEKVQHYDPEVSLAVRLGERASVPTQSLPTVDDDGLDEFLSSHGFEFIEGDRAHRRPTQDTGRHSDDEDSGIPGLPRVVDALSTIMWPSLVQSEASLKRKSRARDLIGWALEEEADDGLRALIADPSAASASSDPASAPTTSAAAKRKSRMQREMEELERWLEDEEAGAGIKYSRGDRDGKPLAYEAAQPDEEDEEARIWVSSAPVSSADGWEDMMTPPAIRTPRADHDAHEEDSTSEHGFEDDFADFVDASAHPHLHAHSHADRLLEVNYDVGRLTPMHTGITYRSLGSVSDFGADDSMFVSTHGEGEYGELSDDEDDPDMPSQTEILETSRRLFGTAARAPPTEPSTSTAAVASASSPAATASALHDTPPLRPTTQSSASADTSVSLESEDGDGDESFAAFDLSRVFSALQGMKDEIAGMEDEDERRRAAARVALGLVYGLGVGGGDRPERGEQAASGQTDA